MDLYYQDDFIEPWNAGWTLAIDNDLFAGTSEDRDYTGGITVTLRGRRASEQKLSLDRGLKWLDRRTGFASAYRTSTQQRHAIQFGILQFTPDDLSKSQPIGDDRPYASLVFFGNSQASLHPSQRKMYESTVIVGLLGTPIGESLQNGIHSTYSGDKAEGFDNQISDGGELTARYSVARHSLLRSTIGQGGRYDIKLMLEGSVGYLTEASVGLGLRWGKIRTPWWSSTSEYADYAPRPTYSPRNTLGGFADKESYLWAGVRLRARAYTVFLQGQFQDSAVTFSSSELEPVVAEAWIGYTTEFRGLRITGALRHQTQEIKRGPGARDLTWGGLSFTRRF